MTRTNTMLEVSGLGHRYGGANGHQAIADLTFEVRTGELACIVGPSGCGKSTMLRGISGLIKPTTGDVKLHGEPVEGVPSDLAVVFQDYSRSLFPWKSVRANVEFPLQARGVSRAERRERADEVLEWVNEVRARMDIGPPLEELPRGRRCTSSACPIARALGGAGVSRSDVFIRTYPQATVIPLPDFVREFIENFDAGAYRYLDMYFDRLMP